VNILILHSQVPFVRGGAEVLVEGLRDALLGRGHLAEIVALPLQWNPPEQLLSIALAWRLLDLTNFNGREVDLVICTKFPTWAARHRRKALWLVHQHRQVYDLHGTGLSEFGPDADSRSIRERVIDIDRIGIAECRPRFAISRNVSQRLLKYNGLTAQPLYPPVPRRGLRPVAYEPFILVVGRLDRAKRVDVAVQAMAQASAALRLEIAGDGPDRTDIERWVAANGMSDRVTIHGRVSDDHLVQLYNRCRAVYYAPIDEDYGYAAVEALKAGKPVITAADSGGVLEFVIDGVTGVVTSLEPQALAGTFDRFTDEFLARTLGGPGRELTAGLTWDSVVDALLAGTE
jgi:glycosyltransferase involved in cell wall biosynthesis